MDTGNNMDQQELHKDVKDILARLGKIEVAMASVQAVVNGGPGRTPYCLEHMERLKSLEQRERKGAIRMSFYIGGLAVLVFLINLYMPHIRAVLNIPK